eukprot:scaffold291258_cov27-Tisochrysis_lutea.AAC.1
MGHVVANRPIEGACPSSFYVQLKLKMNACPSHITGHVAITNSRKAKCNTIMIDPASGKASMQRETRAPEQKLQQQLASDGRSQGALTAKAAHLASLREGAHVLQQQARPGHDLGCDCVQVAEERACKPSLGLIQS